jgi:hypothetical protein
MYREATPAPLLGAVLSVLLDTLEGIDRKDPRTV